MFGREDELLPSKELLITLHPTKDIEERMVATKLGQALNCDVATFREVGSGTKRLPSTQTRVVFHGHGGSDMFGSAEHHLAPEEFAAEMIELLRANPKIRDIDLLSCNLGLIDSKGSCYAAVVQNILDNNGYDHVNINTFIVENRDNDVLDSFFVVGMSEHHEDGLLKPTDYSLDLLRKSNPDQVSLHKKIHEGEEQIAICKAKLDVLGAMDSACRQEITTLQGFKDDLLRQGYNEKQITRMMKDFEVKFHSPENADNYFTCNIAPDKKFTFSGDGRKAGYAIEAELAPLTSDHEKFSKQFAKLRSEAKNTRIAMGRIEDIRTSLNPARLVAQFALLSNLVKLSSLKSSENPKELGRLIMKIVNAPKADPDIQILDIYAKNLAQIFLTYTSSNAQRTLALNQLATHLGTAYSQHMETGKPINECIGNLKTEAQKICAAVKDNHKKTGTLSFPNSPFGSFSLTSSSLEKKINQAMTKSEEDVNRLEMRLRT